MYDYPRLITLSHLLLHIADELKVAEGLISKLQRRVRNSVKEAQDLVSKDVKVVDLSSGESFELI